jgi:FAS-associated factor 2
VQCRLLLQLVRLLVQLSPFFSAPQHTHTTPTNVSNVAGAVRSLLALAAPPSQDGAEQAAAFAAAFAAQHGSLAPVVAWTAASWRDAALAAHRQFKFLFVLLHSPEHDAADRFVSGTLRSPELLGLVEQHCLAWGGDVRCPDAAGLAARLGVSTFPAVGLLAFSGSRTKLVALAQGGVPAGQLVAAFQRGIEQHAPLLLAERLEREERVRCVVLLFFVSTTRLRLVPARPLHSAS